MQELRFHPRIPVDKNIGIVDINTETTLGRLANLSLGGFMLLAHSEIAPNQLFQLRLQLPEKSGDIELGAECLWSQETSDQRHYWAGFQIIDISDQNANLIEQLLSYQ
ncbi:MAG: PilZ domain-containing protein [Gammaproteobacteria bacterium]|nr:PilZ domain-containing protein [Gammaproteobacteria bacterium]